MANKDIFCNIPWYEININHDGSYDLCGCQNDKLVGTAQGQVHNIKVIPVQEYWNSERIRKSRLLKLGDTPDPMCKMCQLKDSLGYQSNRVKENIKNAIFPENFERSFQQSMGYDNFKYSEINDGYTQSTPHSLHVNLGNHCNFSCRMCSPYASTKVQTEFIQLQWLNKNDKMTHWTESTEGWNNFVSFLDESLGNIRVMHIIGGEVEFIPKFETLIDYFIDHGVAGSMNISFTTNGSVDYSKYYPKLSKYKRCEIGVSIESVDPIGDYVRQGGSITEILKNIVHLKTQAPDNIQFVIRTVPNLLSMPYYANLIRWAWENIIPIDNSVLVWPAWLRSSMLADSIKKQIIQDLTQLLSEMPEPQSLYLNQKNTHMIDASIRNECEAMIKLMNIPYPDDGDLQLSICADKLSQWDKLKRTNLKDYSEILYTFLCKHGYKYAGH